MRKALRGFTLLEIMVVLGVIVLLAATLYPSYALYRQRANVALLMTSSNKVLHALELHAIDHGSYPTASITPGSVNVLLSYSDKETPWPWDRNKTVEQNFYYYPSMENFQICWPIDSTANKAAMNMASGTVILIDNQFANSASLAVCATASTDPAVVYVK